jgi:hypothetical protein
MAMESPARFPRPGAVLEFQFQEYADLRKGVNNHKHSTRAVSGGLSASAD